MPQVLWGGSFIWYAKPLGLLLEVFFVSGFFV
jgi:hypothetical protein